MKRLALTCAVSLCVVQAVLGQEARSLGKVKLKGDLGKDSTQVSAVGIVGNYLVLGADEKRHVYVFKKHNESRYDLAGDPLKLPAEGKEIDIEGIACEGATVYVVGSHSRTRGKVDPEDNEATYEENVEKIATIKPINRDREQLFRFKLNADGSAGPIESTSLRTVIADKKVLQPFRELPSKENGIDIEGLAVRGERLFVGFRGPVLTGGYVPVLICKFADPIASGDLVFVKLGGRGIRDLTRSNDGLLVLAGPVGEGPGSYQLYSWDGLDCLPGKRATGRQGRCDLLCKVPTEKDAKAEGVTILKETDRHYEVLIVYDGPENGGAEMFRVAKLR